MALQAIDDDVPLPLVEVGDYVRLNEPYKPNSSVFTGPLKETVKALVDKRWRGGDEESLGSRAPPYLAAYEQEEYEDLFTFTHGTIVEIVSRFNWSHVDEPRVLDEHLRQNYQSEVPTSGGNVPGPARNVSLHLFNPKTGLMYVGGHPTEPGKPEFVDFHVANISLVHKASETWGNEYDLHIGEVYDDWGIPVPLEEE